jgi:hypothetical protein
MFDKAGRIAHCHWVCCQFADAMKSFASRRTKHLLIVTTRSVTLDAGIALKTGVTQTGDAEICVHRTQSSA